MVGITEAWFRCYGCSLPVLVRVARGGFLAYGINGLLHYCRKEGKKVNPVNLITQQIAKIEMVSVPLETFTRK